MFKDFSCVSFNCYGFKSSNAYIKKLCDKNGIVFLCEHWLKMCEMSNVQLQLQKAGYWTHFKSSMDPEIVQSGRSYGGVGFVCHKQDQVSFRPINIDSNRVCAIQILYKSKAILTVFGVYMPYYNASKEHYEMYVETLDKIQVLIDSYAKDSPIMMCGDFNTVLPQHSLLRHSWYRQKPFNEYSLLLYDFMCNNNLITCNFNFEQPINFTYFKGQNSSYIDHVLVSKYLNESVLECSIVCNDVDCTSDHYPLRTRIQMYINNIEEQRKCSDSVHFYPKPEWNSPNFKIKYSDNLKHLLKFINEDSECISTFANKTEAQAYINAYCDKLISIIQKAVYMSKETFNGKLCNKRRNYW